MTAESPRPKEGWSVPARPPLIALALTIGTLTVGVAALGHVYDDTIRQRTHPPVVRFPAPELERVQTPPDRSRPDYAQPAPPGIDAAMAETAAQGDALWQGAQP